MLTVDELEALRNDAKAANKFAREAFGGGPLSPAEIDAQRRGDEWWAKRLAQLREEEKRGRYSVSLSVLTFSPPFAS